MALLPIAQIGRPVLRQVARELTLEELQTERWQTFIDDLVDTMHDANGAGLAANQVFTPVRIAAIEVKPNNPRYPYKPAIPLTVLVNPVVTPLTKETFENYEGCLSVPDMRGVVRRFLHIRVDFLDRHGNAHSREVHGLTAGTYQHELDHLDGKVFLDRVNDPSTLVTWKNFARYHQADFSARARAIVAEHGS